MNTFQDIWFAVVNPNAGSGKTLAQWRETESLLFEKGIRYKFVTPESKIESTKRIKAACRAGYREFIAVGGDGTVHQVLHSILSYINDLSGSNNPVKLSEFTLAVLPIGSGNDWLRSHNIPHDHRKIVELIARRSFFPQDIVMAEVLDPANGKTVKRSYMANIGGYCFDANICDVVNFQKLNGKTGKFLYINAIRRQALAQKAFRTKILCDGTQVFDDLLYSISIGNGKYSGGGLCQTPSAVIDDGILDMMVAPKFPTYKIFFNIKKILQGRTEQIPFLKFFRARKIEIIPEGQGQLIEVDGDVIGRAPVRFSVLPEQLNVLHLTLPDARDAAGPSQS